MQSGRFPLLEVGHSRTVSGEAAAEAAFAKAFKAKIAHNLIDGAFAGLALPLARTWSAGLPVVTRRERRSSTTAPSRGTGRIRPHARPHPSPRGGEVLYLAYTPGTAGHPLDRGLALRILFGDNGSVRALMEVFGGQGSFNVSCWSREGDRFAYVGYARRQYSALKIFLSMQRNAL